MSESSDSETSKFVKRILDSGGEESDMDPRPSKLRKLNSTRKQAITNALLKRLELTSAEKQAGTNAQRKQHKLNSTGTQAGPNDSRIQPKLNSAEEQAVTNTLLNNNQELRGEDHSAEPSEQNTPHSDATVEPPKRKVTGKTESNRSQITKALSQIKVLQKDNKYLREQLEANQKQRDDTIKDKADAVLKSMKAETEKATKACIDKMAADLKSKLEKTEKKLRTHFDKTEKRLRTKFNETEKELRTKLDDAEDIRKESEEQHKLRLETLSQEHQDEIAQINDNNEAAIAKFQEAADQAAASAKEADDRHQKALRGKEAAESTLVSMHKELRRHNELLEHQRHTSHVAHTKHRHAKQQFRLMASTCRPGDPDAMQCDPPEFVPPSKSDVAPPTPESQNSPSFLTSSVSSINTATAEKTGSFTHQYIPRPSSSWASRPNATPFAQSTPSKVSDPENIAMHNHSRDGFSSDMSHNNESPAQQAPMTFGRPSGGHLTGQQQQVSPYTPGPSSLPNVHPQRVGNVVTGAGQSNSRRAPRTTAVQTNNTQQHGDDLNGADQSSSRRAVPPLRPQSALDQLRVPRPSNNNISNSNGTPRPAQNTSSRIPRRVNRSPDAQYSNSGYVAPQSHNQGGLAQAGPAPPSGPAQQTDPFAQARLAADKQRVIVRGGLVGPSQGQPQQSQRGGSMNGRGGPMNGRGGSLNGRGGSMNSRGGPSNNPAGNRNQAYDELDQRPTTARQSQSNSAPIPPLNPFASQGGPSPDAVILDIGGSFAEIIRKRGMK